MRFQGEYLRILLLIKSCDVESNPGAKKQSCLKFFHWNLNGLAAHEFIKLPLIEAYIATRNFDIVYLSETFLDSSISNDGNTINIAGYLLIRADHPSNTKKGSVCIYYKDFLSLIKRDDITNVKKCLIAVITVDNEKCFFTCFYRSQKNCGQFSGFCKDFNILLNNINGHIPSYSVIVGDFSAK